MSQALERPQAKAARAGRLAERAALRLGTAVNETATGRALQNAFMRGFGYVWMRGILSRHTIYEGLEDFRALYPDRGVMLVSNHRSFFDLYVVSVGFFAGPSPWIERLAFPVKADFFYERWLGIFTNMIACGGVMYPPFFRQRDKMRRNRDSLRTLVDFLAHPGAVVGFHPEGTRNKTGDVYSLLPMQPGAGEIALRSSAIVVPVFVNGLGNSLLSEIRKRFSRDARREPVICVFGAPIDLSAFASTNPGPSAQKRAADRMGESIAALTTAEKTLRAQAEAGAIDPADPRWLKNRAVSRFYAYRT
jgi:1-acyl-sn-glycerol-3-phosphate acyltransferase